MGWNDQSACMQNACIHRLKLSICADIYIYICIYIYIVSTHWSCWVGLLFVTCFDLFWPFKTSISWAFFGSWPPSSDRPGKSQVTWPVSPGDLNEAQKTKIKDSGASKRQNRATTLRQNWCMECVTTCFRRFCWPVSCEHQRLHPSGDSSDVEGFGDCNIAVYTYNASITGSHEHWLPKVWEGLKHQEREYKLNLQYTCHQYQVISNWWFHTHFLLYIPGEENPSWPKLVGH